MAKSRVTDTDRGARELGLRVAKYAIEGLAVKVGVIGDAASRVHVQASALDKKTENFLIKEASRGNADAANQLDELREKDSVKRINAIFKPGPTMAEIGEIHEFGLGNNPERSWLRAYVDENASNIQAKIKRVAEAMVKQDMTPEAGLNLLGLSVVGGIKKRIQAAIAPPLAASTLRKKGPNKTTPLINTAQFIGSISHQVVTAEAARNSDGGLNGGG
jgi:hypothetical protein